MKRFMRVAPVKTSVRYDKKLKQYRVLYEFEGCYEAQVTATSEEEAIEKGREEFYFDDVELSEVSAHAVTEEEYEQMGGWN